MHESWTRRAGTYTPRGTGGCVSRGPEGAKARDDRGVTLVEMMVTLSILVVLAGILLTGISRTFAAAHATSCLSNERQIGQALMLFYHQNMSLPSDSDQYTLRQSLSPYLTDPGVFKCPSDAEGTSEDSYQAYYVRHLPTDGTKWFTLGCPRHAGRGVTLFFNGGVRISDLGRVTADGSTIRQSAPAAERTVSGGDLQFEDGSIVSVGVPTAGSKGVQGGGGAGKPGEGIGGGTGGGKPSKDFGVTVIESFRTGDGPLYSVIRIVGDGVIGTSVNTGSKFDVVTPSAIVSARGTRFTVTTSGDGTLTSVKATEGEVWLTDRSSGGIQVLKAGDPGRDSGSATNPDPDCIHCPSHCKNGKHCRNCPLEPKHDHGQGGS